nr:retrotransposon protein, putative, unclassified [Tanacetum cinerariifolium]
MFPWSSRIIRYARSRPNGKMIVDSIENGPYVRRMIVTPGEPDLSVPVPESFREQTDEELTENDIKRMDADDQAIQTILLGLLENIYAAVDSCETAKEIWERVRQMMKGSDTGEQEKKAKLFNEWEKFTSTDGESIESYYHRFMQLMNDLKRNKHFPKNITANLKFLNNLQPEWKRHITIVRQTKNLHEADFTQIYDFLKMNHDELLIAQKEEAGIQLQAEEFDFMAAVGDLDEIEEVNANCILMANLQHASTSGTQLDKAPVYDTDGLAKVERLQAQLRDLKGKSSDTPNASNTLDPLNQKLKSNIEELEFQVLRVRVFENTCESMNNTSGTSVTPHVDQPKLSAVTPHSKKLHASIPSHSVPQPREFNVMKHGNVITPGMFKFNPSQTSRVDLVPSKQSSASIRANPITNFQRHVIFKEKVSSDTVNASFTGLVHTARTRRPQPKGITRNARAPSASKSSEVKKNVTVEDHRRTLLLSKNQKTISSECNNFKLAIQNDKSKIVCGCSKHMTKNIKLLINFVWKFLGTVRFGNDHIAAILGYGDLKWGNITINRVYFIEGGTLTSLEIWMVLTCSKEIVLQIYTPLISKTWPQLLSYVSWPVQLLLSHGYGINDYPTSTSTPSTTFPKMISSPVYQSLNMIKNIFIPLVSKEKSKRASHPPKPIPNSKHRLHLLHMDMCGPMRVASINGKWYVLVIIDDYSRYTWVYFLRTNDEMLEVIKNFLKKIYVRLQALVIIVRSDNGTEFKNHVLKEYFDSVGITHETSAAKTPQQNGVVERRNRTLVEAARTMLIFSHAPLFLWDEAIATAKLDISYLHVFGALCYPKNDREDIGKLGAKGDIGFCIGYFANSIAYRVYYRRTKKIIETINVTFDELSAMAFEQNNSAPAPKNSSNTSVSSHNVDAPSQQHSQQQSNPTPSPTASTVDNDLNVMFEGGLFVNPFATPSTESIVSSTQYVDPSNMHTFFQPYPHDYQWTKDHPLEQVIGEPSRPVLTRNQLKTDGDIIIEPKSVKEALIGRAWIESMQEELHQFIRLDVWELVPSPDGIKPFTLKWLFKIKHDEENTVIRNKTRLVDILGIRCTQRIHNVSNGCENCISEWFIERRRQAPRAWYDKLSTFLLQNGFSKGTIDPTLFTRRFDDDILVVQVYVDDIIFGLTDPRYATLFSDLMKSRFKMSMMGEMMFFLGLQVNQSPNGIFINQSNYVKEILKKYGLNTCDIIGTPMDIKDKLDLDQIGTPVDATKYRSMIGALVYLTSSRPDIVHATCDSGFELTGFSDADYAGCKDTFKSTSGGAQFLGEKLVSWSSNKQDCTSLSTMKSKYVSLSACCAQVLWMRMQLTDYGYHFNKILIYCDSKLAIVISCNPVQHSRTKHIAVRYHFIKEHVEKGTIELYFVKTDHQLADIFTKALLVDRFNYLVCRLGIRSLCPQELDHLAKLH